MVAEYKVRNFLIDENVMSESKTFHIILKLLNLERRR